MYFFQPAERRSGLTGQRSSSRVAVTADNFAGASGQEHAIRYAGVGLYHGRSLDMVITQAAGAPT